MFTKLTTIAGQQVFGLLALFVALGGTSYAVAAGSIDTVEIKNNTIRSKDLRNNDVRSGDVRNGTLLKKDFRKGQVPIGPQGARGPQGPGGPRGLPGTARAYGRVSAGGVLDPARSKNVSSVVHPYEGTYCISLAPGIDPAGPGTVATIDATESGQASKVSVAPENTTGCPVGTLQILTSTLYDPDPTDPGIGETSAGHGFVFLVP